MIFRCMSDCVKFLEREGELVRIPIELDPDLEMAAVHNRVFEAGGPAILFEKVKGSPFPAVSNVFGTYSRALKILEPELSKVTGLVRLKSDPSSALKSPFSSLRSITSLRHALPLKKKLSPETVSNSVLSGRCRISDLPMIRCWPGDGGGFILLPQVFSIDPDFFDGSGQPGLSPIMHSNIGMYRVQMSGGTYAKDSEVGIHYQIHRGIGNHHAKMLEKGLPLPVTIFVGGPPAHTLSAVMPLPEAVPEVSFAGVLAGRAFRYTIVKGGSSCQSVFPPNFTAVAGPDCSVSSVVSLDADFCITGHIIPGKTKPEGPFGDHIGYYSLTHDFPYLKVDAVYHRKDAIWPFTVVGRPPREDSVFGKIIHEITASAIPDTIPGVTAVHAVDAAGVHPLLFAKAMERYAPYESKKPRELLTHANAILGTGQLSLAKYLFICSHSDNPSLDINEERAFLSHVLERVDFTRDLHFQTCTTMDTLDYSAEGLNEGSKVVIVGAGEVKRTLATTIPYALSGLSAPFCKTEMVAPGMVVIQGPGFTSYQDAEKEIGVLVKSIEASTESARIGSNSGIAGSMKIAEVPLIVIVDDSSEAGRSFETFLWITFSRSNPSHDIYGVGSFTSFKHWGCRGSLILDARIKPFHAPALMPDPEVERKIESLACKGGPLYGIF